MSTYASFAGPTSPATHVAHCTTVAGPRPRLPQHSAHMVQPNLVEHSTTSSVVTITRQFSIIFVAVDVSAS
eukprot:4712318-Heterocapsa_arctica.AAC.1